MVWHVETGQSASLLKVRVYRKKALSEMRRRFEIGKKVH